MCTVLLPPGGYPTAVNKYVISYHLRRIRLEVLTALLKSSAIRGGEFLDTQDEGSIISRYLIGDTTACPPRPRPSKYRVTYRSPAICGLLKGAVVFDFPGRWIHSHQLFSQHAPGDSHSCVLFHSCAPLRQGDQTCVQYKATIVFDRTEQSPGHTRLQHWVSSEIFIPHLVIIHILIIIQRNLPMAE
jgi:hypothetical protein